MATTPEWQQIKCGMEKALSQTTPERVVTAIGNLWNDHSLGLRDRPQFVADLSSAILDCYKGRQRNGNDLTKIAEECFRMVVEYSEGRKLDNNDPLPELLEFARKRLNARLHPNDPDEVFPWLKLCYDVTNKDAAHYFSLFEEWDRDDEMRSLVFDEDRTSVRAYFLEDRSSKVHLRKIAEWFLRRYDLQRALQLSWRLKFSCPSIAKGAKFFMWAIPFLFLFLFIWFFLENKLLVGLFVVLTFSSLTPWLFLDILLPRMLAGTAIGYLFVLPSKDFWEFAVSPKADAGMEIGVLAGLTLFASWFYLYYGEVKKVAHKRREASARALLIFLIGLSQSIAIGFTLSGLLAPSLARWQGWECQLVKAAEWFGIFPKALVFQVSVAFFVGILSQILWEDKPVTEPL